MSHHPDTFEHGAPWNEIEISARVQMTVITEALHSPRKIGVSSFREPDPLQITFKPMDDPINWFRILSINEDDGTMVIQCQCDWTIPGDGRCRVDPSEHYSLMLDAIREHSFVKGYEPHNFGTWSH